MKKHTYLFFSLVFLFISCGSPLKIVKSYEDNKEKPIKEMALFPVMIGKLNKPIFPLIDASIFNEKPNKIAPKILEIQNQKVNEFREIAAQSLSKNFNSTKVITSDSLVNSSVYKDLFKRHHKPESLLTKDPNFSTLAIAKNDMNVFPFENDNVLNYFKTDNKSKGMVGLLCKELGVDAIAISYSFINVGSVLPFGVSAKINLFTYIYIIDSQGVLIAEARAFSKGFQTSGTDPQEFRLVLDDFATTFDPMIQKLVGK